jgi:hypothetical protein
MRQKKQFFHKQVAANKVKETRKIIKEKTGNYHHDDSINKITCGNTVIKNPKEIANAFNKYYTNIITNLNIKHRDTHKASILLNNFKLGNIVQMKTTPVSEAEVNSIMLL